MKNPKKPAKAAPVPEVDTPPPKGKPAQGLSLPLGPPPSAPGSRLKKR